MSSVTDPILHGALNGLLTHDETHGGAYNLQSAPSAASATHLKLPSPIAQYKQPMIRCIICIAIFLVIMFVLLRTYHPQLPKDVDHNLDATLTGKEFVNHDPFFQLFDD